MARVEVRADLELDEPTLVEGFPGVGLVGKIATDHLVEELGMTYYAGVYCDGIPRVAIYRTESADVVPPVRIYADDERDLLVLQSDVPVSPRSATEFAACVSGWFDENDVTPVLLSGRPDGDEEDGEVYGVATGDGSALLDEAGIPVPTENGYVSGPTGALLARAEEQGRTSVALVVPSDPQFPDPEAAKRMLEEGILPLTGVDVDTAPLSEDAEEIREARERLARRMQRADDEASQAQPLRMFQ